MQKHHNKPGIKSPEGVGAIKCVIYEILLKRTIRYSEMNHNSVINTLPSLWEGYI